MKLREALIRAIDQGNKKTRGIITYRPKIAKIANKLEQIYSKSGAQPIATDLNEIRSIFINAEKNNSWANISNKIWKKACWVLWTGKEHLAENKIFLDKYISYCEMNTSSRIVASLINAYLKDFNESYAGVKIIAKLIRHKLQHDRIKHVLKRWVDRDKIYNLFEQDKIFNHDAEKYNSSEYSATRFLHDMGLDGHLESANYSQRIYSAILEKFRLDITKTDNQVQLFAKIMDISVAEDHSLRYPDKKKLLINTLLSPWITKNPTAELKKAILDLLLKYFKDPRTAEGSSNWIGIGDNALRVIRKWLADKTLEQFFLIIKKTAKDNHWTYRQKFWKAYYDDGHIDDAWVVLGKDSRTEAKYQARHGDELIAGSVKGTGVKSDHSVLIFKVAGLTISEWSHDGKCRIWTESNGKSPELYQELYIAENLREHENQSFHHYGSERYGWQKNVADYIERYTGIKMPTRKYEVK